MKHILSKLMVVFMSISIWSIDFYQYSSEMMPTVFAQESLELQVNDGELARTNVDNKQVDAKEFVLNVEEFPVGTEFAFTEAVDTNVTSNQEIQRYIQAKLPNGEIVGGESSEYQVTIELVKKEKETKIVNETIKTSQKIKVVREDDCTLPLGEEMTIDDGQHSFDEEVYQVNYVNGQEVNRELISKDEIQSAEPKIIKVGIRTEANKDDCPFIKVKDGTIETTSSQRTTDDASGFVTNKDDFPEGTIFKFTEEVNTSVSVGAKTTRYVYAILPDGAKHGDRQVPEYLVTIEMVERNLSNPDINEDLADIDRYQVEVQDGCLLQTNDTNFIDASDFVVNKDELPAGTKFEFTRPINRTVYSGNVSQRYIKIIYPDGTVEGSANDPQYQVQITIVDDMAECN